MAHALIDVSTTQLVTGEAVVVTMNRPERRNALSLAHLTELLEAFGEASTSGAVGIILAANGPVFSAGHDFGEMATLDEAGMRHMLETCAELMQAIRSAPQVVIAQVQGLATAAGAQLVATCDLAVASSVAGFAAPGGRGGWFCHTPMVAIGRSLPPKRALEMGFTGDTIDAETALAWGFVNRVVPGSELRSATEVLLTAATRGSRSSKALGKAGFYTQIDLNVADAYVAATDLMVSASLTEDGREGIESFAEKRPPVWADRTR